VNVRIIASTNKNLENEIVDKRFRKDLFYGTAILQIALLPLRKRPEDLIMIAEYLLKKLGDKNRESYFSLGIAENCKRLFVFSAA
jgi:transcriptional regulator with PAS, ATPase and Fis domain